MDGKEFTVSTPSKIDFDKYLIDLSTDYAEPEVLLEINGKIIFSRRNVSGIVGNGKSCKTFLVSLLSAKFIKDFEDEVIIIFDTEQAKPHTAKTAKRIHKILEFELNINNPNIKVYNLREIDTTKRREFVADAIETYKPALVFIDGVRDLVGSVNDDKECAEIINELMRLSSIHNCNICCILHLNPNGTKERGHLGSELVFKAESILAVERTTGSTIINVNPKYCRNSNFETFAFVINDEVTPSIPEFCDPVLNKTSPKVAEELEEIFNATFADSSFLSYTALTKKIVDIINKSEKTAERRIESAVKAGIITKNKIGQYFLTSSKEPKTENEIELPY